MELSEEEVERVKLERLILAQRKLSEHIKAEDEAHKANIAPYKDQLSKVEAKVFAMLEVQGESGGKTSHKIKGYMGYVQEPTKYAVADREALEEWVLEAPEERLTIFPQSVIQGVIKQYRLDTGAKTIEDDKIKGGKLPSGVSMKTYREVKFRKV